MVILSLSNEPSPSGITPDAKSLAVLCPQLQWDTALNLVMRHAAGWPLLAGFDPQAGAAQEANRLAYERGVNGGRKQR